MAKGNGKNKGKDPVIREHCGTYAGLQEHTRWGERSCESCKRARAEYTREWRFRTGRQHIPFLCHDCGSVFPEHHCTGPFRER